MLRIFDIGLSLIALAFLSPLLIPIALLLRLTGEGEILYRQERMGYNGEIFSLLKFATMLKNSPNIGTGTITVNNDPRILPVGAFLRKTKINELPQLLNILGGSMSVVGPRPLTPETFNYYPTEIQKKITSVRPGLSGVGSIIFRNEEQIISQNLDAKSFYKQTIAPYKGRLEEWFATKSSTKVYFQVIYVTLWLIIFPSSKIAWKIFPDIPKCPKNLFNLL